MLQRSTWPFLTSKMSQAVSGCSTAEQGSVCPWQPRVPWGSHVRFRPLLPQATCAMNDLQKELLHAVTCPRELKFPSDQSYSMAWDGYLAVHKGNKKGFSLHSSWILYCLFFKGVVVSLVANISWIERSKMKWGAWNERGDWSCNVT